MRDQESNPRPHRMRSGDLPASGSVSAKTLNPKPGFLNNHSDFVTDTCCWQEVLDARLKALAGSTAEQGGRSAPTDTRCAGFSGQALASDGHT